MSLHTGCDQDLVFPRPFDEKRNPLGYLDPSLETQFGLRLLGAAEALARSIPIPGGQKIHGGWVTGGSIDRDGQLGNGRLSSRGEVVGFRGLPGKGAPHQPAGHVLDVDEVATGASLVLQGKRFLA